MTTQTTIKAFLSNKNNVNLIRWALIGIAQGDLNKVAGFNDLNGDTKTLISIYKAQIIKAAEKAGVNLSGEALAKDFGARLTAKAKADAPYDKKSLAESVYGVDIDSVC